MHIGEREYGEHWIYPKEIDMETWERKTMSEKIQILVDNNEKGSTRTQALILAASSDARFETPKFAELDVDVQFSITELQEWPIDRDYEGKLMREPEMVTRQYNCELKKASDYVSTVLGKDAHGYMQYLAMAESGNLSMFLVLGGDQDISDAIYDSLKTRYNGKELSFQIASYEKRLHDFEAHCEALHCPVERWEKAPYSRLLSRVAKALLGASLLGYAPRPEENEREIVAASCLFKGIGPKILAEVLSDYDLCFVPKKDFARQPCDMPGIGPKRSAMIDSRIVMAYGFRGRA
jgi:hypothetical protein